MIKKTDRIVLICYLLGFLAVASVIALMQPLADTPPLYGNPPDEHARFLVPWYIYEHGVIPTGFEEEIRIPSYGFSYALYNAFPYVVQGYLMRFAGLFTDSMQILLYVARFVNVTSGCLMAYVVYLIGGKLFGKSVFRWVFCFSVMFLPQNLFMHTYVNTDSMCLLSTAMIVYALVGAYQEGFTRANSLWLSGGIILCALSYYNAYGYILSSILLFLAYFLQKRDGKLYYDYRQMLKTGLFISILVLLGIGWWFLRSYFLYDGDFIGLKTRDKMAQMYAVPDKNPLNLPTYENRGYTVWEMIRETDFFEAVFLSSVAAYGSMSIKGNIWMYRLYKILLATGLLSCIFLPGRAKREVVAIPGKSQKEGLGKSKMPFGVSRMHKIFFHANMIFCIVMPIILLLYYAFKTDYQDQGRYILPMIVPLFYYLTRGFQKLTELNWIPKAVRAAVAASVIALPLISTLGMLWRAVQVYLQTGMVLR